MIHSTASDFAAINCTIGMDTHTPVIEGQVINLRRGETLIVNCVGDREDHSSLTLDYEGRHEVLKRNKSGTLKYTWYCEISTDGNVTVSGFEARPPHNAAQLIAFTVQSHDLNALLAPTTSTTPPPVGGINGANRQNPSSTGEEDTDTGRESTTTTSKAVTDYRFYGLVCAVVVLMTLLVVFVLLVVVFQIRRRRKVSTLEEGPEQGHELDKVQEQRVEEGDNNNTSILDTSSTELQRDGE